METARHFAARRRGPALRPLRSGGQVPVPFVPLQSRGCRSAAGPFLGDQRPLSVRFLEEMTGKMLRKCGFSWDLIRMIWD